MTGAFNSTLNRIFGLDGLGFGTPDAMLVFERPLPGWGWALIIALALTLGVWTYRGLLGSRGTRVWLGLMRGALIVLLALLAAGPALRLDQMRTERDRVFVLTDQSASMAVPDAPGNISRWQQSQNARMVARTAYEQLSQRSDIEQWRFGARTVANFDQQDGTQPDDSATRLGEAIRATLDAARGSPIGGIVIYTDGRTTDSISPEDLRRLKAERVPIFPVPLGSPEPVRSVSIDRIESANVTFARDTVPVRVRLDWSGGAPEDARIQLVDRSTGSILDESRFQALSESKSADGEWVTLTATPSEPGTLDLEVRLLDVGDDIDPEDNIRSLPIEIIDRPIRVLYVDGGPRWEQRYIKNLLLRESSIDASILLLASGRRYAQEGDTLIARLPVSPEEWDTFDVIILGDVSGELFGGEQLAALTEHVAQRGAGVLWMAGPGATPRSWLETPASPLLPVRTDPEGTWDEPVTALATPESDRLGVLRTDDEGKAWNPRLSEPGAGWTRLQWAQRLVPSTLKPGVSVLGDAVGVSSGETLPLVLSMRYGSGRVVYVGTDEIWRWRYGRGETIPERFWVPLIRMLARGRVESALGPGVLRVRPELLQPGTPAIVELEVFDQSVIDRLPERIRARIVRADGRRDLVELRGEGSTRSGEWVPDAPGSFRVELVDAPSELATLDISTRVIQPGDERADLNTDHPYLADLAERTGGQVVNPEDTDRLAELIPNRSRVHAGTPVIETLWDRWVVLVTLLAMLTIEWVGRRITRLA